MKPVPKADPRYDVQTHFAFGENWADYAAHIGDNDIARAQEWLTKLIPASDIKGRRVLDIGCGSGLHALAALRLGAGHVTCIDIDENSVATARAVVGSRWGAANFEAYVHNVLSPAAHPSLPPGGFDIVYSWGVLHHTGAMWEALERAAAYVAPGGTLAIALYKRTPLCGFWKAEKKFYAGLPRWARAPFNWMYAGGLMLAKTLRGENAWAYVRDYRRRRGMRFMTDVTDWMGGYPYESASPGDVQAFLAQRGFIQTALFNAAPAGSFGLFGSGCAEYVFRRR